MSMYHDFPRYYDGATDYPPPAYIYDGAGRLMNPPSSQPWREQRATREGEIRSAVPPTPEQWREWGERKSAEERAFSNALNFLALNLATDGHAE